MCGNKLEFQITPGSEEQVFKGPRIQDPQEVNGGVSPLGFFKVCFGGLFCVLVAIFRGLYQPGELK